MLAPHEGNDSLETAAAAPAAGDSSGQLPCFDDSPESLAEDTATPFVRPLGSLLDDDSGFVLGNDEETVELPASPLRALAPLLRRESPLTWVFAGARLKGDASFGDGRVTGEWFAEEWRAECGRQTDLVIEATWPVGYVAVLKSHLKSRVVRHRPDVAFLFLDNSDAAAGVEELAQFERRLVAILSVLAEIGATAVLVQTPMVTAHVGVDHEIYFEAVSGIARERGVLHLVLPEHTTSNVQRSRTPDSRSRAAALHLCREAMKAVSSEG